MLPTSSRQVIPFGTTELQPEDAAGIPLVVQSGHTSGNGPISVAVQERLSIMCGVHATFLTPSCSAALEMSARLLCLKPGDEVIVPSYAFATTASSFIWNGARPVFADVDPSSLSITVETVEPLLTERTRAICVLHYGGVADDVAALRAWCDKGDLVLIEDNAHGLGATRDGRSLGSFGHLSTLSFHQTKNITCGEGGALLVQDPRFIERSAILQEKGTDRGRFVRGEVDHYTWRDVGSSWVMSEVLASLLQSQLDRIEAISRRRVSIWDVYALELADWAHGHGVQLSFAHPAAVHTGHLFFLRLPGDNAALPLIRHLEERGIQAASHYQALNTSPMGAALGGTKGDCPVAEAVAASLVRLPLHTRLTDADVARVVAAVKEYEPQAACGSS